MQRCCGGDNRFLGQSGERNIAYIICPVAVLVRGDNVVGSIREQPFQLLIFAMDDFLSCPEPTFFIVPRRHGIDRAVVA